MPTLAPSTMLLNVTITQEDLTVLGGGDASKVNSGNLGVLCSKLIRTKCDGGVMLTVDEVRLIEKSTGKQVHGGADVVKAAQKPVGVVEGANVFACRIDPEFMGPIEELAKEKGITVSQLMEETIDWAIRNNWPFNIDIVGRALTVPQRYENYLEGELGKNYSMADLINAYKALKREKE
jgi:hypothetical protein